MTPQQQTDLATWKQDITQPLPASLENALIERCLDALRNSETRKRFNSLRYSTYLYCRDNLDIAFEGGVFSLNFIKKTKNNLLQNIIQTLLSRTPEGQAVMPFLDVETKEISQIKLYEKDIYFTLDHLLYREFTESLRVGKTFDQALSIINLIYLQNV